jgi:predicted XRE-type DNA-binding protein
MEDISVAGWMEINKKEGGSSMTLMNTDLTTAYSMFLSYITSANQQKPDPDVLDDVYQEKLGRLNHDMRVLEALAVEGMEEQVTPLLNTLLQEWAIKEAVELLLRSQNGVVDPTDHGLQGSFWQKLCRQHQVLLSELLLKVQQGKKQRARAEVERAQSWQSMAARTFENQQNHQLQMFGQYQQANQQWANVAMVGVQQAQLGVKQWYEFAASTQQNVASMLAGTEQRQAVIADQAVQRANTKKLVTKITIIGLLLVGFVAMFGCAFTAMMHLY